MMLRRHLKMTYLICVKRKIRYEHKVYQILKLSEINEIDKEIEYKQTILKTIKVGLIKQNEDLKKLMNTDGEI